MVARFNAWVFFIVLGLIPIGGFATSVGSFVVIEQETNGRTSSYFKGDKNIKFSLNPGTVAQIVEVDRKPSGSCGLKVKVLNGFYESNEAWIYCPTDKEGKASIKVLTAEQIQKQFPALAANLPDPNELIGIEKDGAALMVTESSRAEIQSAPAGRFSKLTESHSEVEIGDEKWIRLFFEDEEPGNQIYWMRESDLEIFPHYKARIENNESGTEACENDTDPALDSDKKKFISDFVVSVKKYQLKVFSRTWGKGIQADKGKCTRYNPEICSAYKNIFGHLPKDVESFAFVKAIIDLESGYNPRATRFEDNNLRGLPRYNAKKKKISEPGWAYDQWKKLVNRDYRGKEPTSIPDLDPLVKKFETSYGLMQVLYATALGFDSKIQPEDLLDPKKNIEMGLRVLKEKYSLAADAMKSEKKLSANRGKTDQEKLFRFAASAYNAGGVYTTKLKKGKNTGYKLVNAVALGLDNVPHAYDENAIQLKNDFVGKCGYRKKTVEQLCSGI